MGEKSFTNRAFITPEVFHNIKTPTSIWAMKTNFEALKVSVNIATFDKDIIALKDSKIKFWKIYVWSESALYFENNEIIIDECITIKKYVYNRLNNYSDFEYENNFGRFKKLIISMANEFIISIPPIIPPSIPNTSLIQTNLSNESHQLSAKREMKEIKYNDACTVITSSDEYSCFGDNDSELSDIDSDDEENNNRDKDKFINLLDKSQRRKIKNLIMSDYLYYDMDWLEYISILNFYYLTNFISNLFQFFF
jgi:hypothetical protein